MTTVVITVTFASTAQTAGISARPSVNEVRAFRAKSLDAIGSKMDIVVVGVKRSEARQAQIVCSLKSETKTRKIDMALLKHAKEMFEHRIEVSCTE